MMKYILLLACITVFLMTAPIHSQPVGVASIAAVADPKQGDLLPVSSRDKISAKDSSESFALSSAVSSPIQALFFTQCHCPEPSHSCSGACQRKRCIMACWQWGGVYFKLCTYCSHCEASTAGFNPNYSCWNA